MIENAVFFQFPFPGAIENAVFFQFPFPGVVENAVFFQFLFFSVYEVLCFSSSLSLSQFPSSSLPVPFPVPFADSLCFSKESALQTFFFKKRKHFCFLFKKSATHFPWKNIGNPRRELGRELGRELEGNWKGTGKEKGNWKNTALRTR